MLHKLKHTSNFIKTLKTKLRLDVYRLTYPNSLTDKVEIDYHQKLIIKFQIKDKQTEEFIRAQQAFLRLTNKKSTKEVIYLAEATGGVNLQYKVEVVRREF
jgi:hypothetical protein